MSLDHLWAGWRMPYVTDASGSPAAGPDATGSDAAGCEACVFCAVLATDASDREKLVVWSGDHVVVMLNAFPYASGHLMVMPRRHLMGLDELEAGESAELWDATLRAVAALRRSYRPEGCNVGLNLGRAAGAGIPGHLHVHVVPRWVGDTNFMTAVAGARVLPEALDVSVRRLEEAWR